MSSGELAWAAAAASGVGVAAAAVHNARVAGQLQRYRRTGDISAINTDGTIQVTFEAGGAVKSCLRPEAQAGIGRQQVGHIESAARVATAEAARAAATAGPARATKPVGVAWAPAVPRAARTR